MLRKCKMEPFIDDNITIKLVKSLYNPWASRGRSQVNEILSYFVSFMTKIFHFIQISQLPFGRENVEKCKMEPFIDDNLKLSWFKVYSPWGQQRKNSGTTQASS